MIFKSILKTVGLIAWSLFAGAAFAALDDSSGEPGGGVSGGSYYVTVQDSGIYVVVTARAPMQLDGTCQSGPMGGNAVQVGLHNESYSYYSSAVGALSPQEGECRLALWFSRPPLGSGSVTAFASFSGHGMFPLLRTAFAGNF
jgi:hypothetical protein